jgi:uncharacterized OsmC-like protein
MGSEAAMDLREKQAPIKERYRAEPGAAMITLRASADETSPMTCSVDIGHAVHQAEAHAGVGGSGGSPCSGDLLLGALAACAQITCQMVATASGVPFERISVHVEGDLDLRGTLGMSRDVRVGFESIRMSFHIDAPDATAKQLASLRRATEQYCVVMQTLMQPPPVEVVWDGAT